MNREAAGMDRNTTEETTYVAARTASAAGPEAARIDLAALPALCWAAAILFTVNIVIVCAIAISPDLNVDMYGETDKSAFPVATLKPSPFVEIPARARPVKRAERLRPVLEPVFPTDQDVIAELMITPPSVTKTERYVSGTQVYDVVKGHSAFPRQTASLLPSSTPTAGGSDDSLPRRTVQRQARHVIIN
jgi:hypothetical protein